MQFNFAIVVVALLSSSNPSNEFLENIESLRSQNSGQNFHVVHHSNGVRVPGV